MAARKGQAKPQYSQDEKRQIVEKVCDLYASQEATIESCCDAVGISSSAFRYWVASNGEFGEIYKKAKAKQDEIFFECLRPIIKGGLRRLLEGEEYEETTIADLHFKGSLSKEKATTIKRGKSAPNPTAVIFAAKGAWPEVFADRSIVNMKTETVNSETLTPELIDKIDALLGDGKGDDESTSIPGKQKGQRGGV